MKKQDNQFYFYSPNLDQPISLKSTKLIFDIEYEILRDKSIREFQKVNASETINVLQQINNAEFNAND